MTSQPSVSPETARRAPPIQGRADREDISSSIQAIKMDTNKPMRRFEPPTNLYELAAGFVMWAPNIVRTNGQRLRFKTDIFYNLLITDVQEKGVTSVRAGLELISGWQAASKALFRYAFNLYLTPNRPEFRRVKLTTSYYYYDVSKKLNHAEKILEAMGYRSVSTTSQTVQELHYSGDVDRDLLLTMATDLIILHSELDLVKALAEQVVNDLQSTPELRCITLTDILLARAKDDLKYQDTWQFLVKTAFQRLPQTTHPTAHTSHPSTPQYRRQVSDMPGEHSSHRAREGVQQSDPTRRGSVPPGQLQATMNVRGDLPPPSSRTPLTRERGEYGGLYNLPATFQTHGGKPGIPGQMQGRAPGQEYGNIPGPKQDSMPGLEHRNIPGPNQGGMPGQEYGNVLGPKQGSMPRLEHHNIPGPNQGSMLGQEYRNIPGSKQQPPSRVHSAYHPRERQGSPYAATVQEGQTIKTAPGMRLHSAGDYSYQSRQQEEQQGNPHSTSGTVHEMLHGKNQRQNALPTDPPIRTSGMTFGQPVDRSLPKGGGDRHYANIGGLLQPSPDEPSPNEPTKKLAIDSHSEPTTPSETYENIVDLLKSEDTSIPRSSTPQRQVRPAGANTDELDQQLTDLYAKFPSLADSYERKPRPELQQQRSTKFSDSVESDMMYGDNEEDSDTHRLETTREEEGEQPAEFSSCDVTNLPEPVVKTKDDLEKLQVEPCASSSFLSMHPEIKDVHSVHDDYGGPNYSYISQPLGPNVRSPELEKAGEVNDKWKVHATLEYSGVRNHGCETERPPGTSPEQHASPYSNVLYGGPSLDDSRHKEQRQPAPARRQLESNTSRLPQGMPPHSPSSRLTTDAVDSQKKPKPLPRKGLGQRSNTMEEDGRERVKVARKSTSASKLEQQSDEVHDTVRGSTGGLGRNQVVPSKQHPPSPLSPRPRRARKSPELPRRSDMKEQDQRETNPVDGIRVSHKPTETGSRKPGSAEYQHHREVPLGISLKKGKGDRVLKSPPTVSTSKAIAAHPDQMGQNDKMRSVHKEAEDMGFTIVDTPIATEIPTLSKFESSEFEEKYWECDYCTNLVINPSKECDVCGTARK